MEILDTLDTLDIKCLHTLDCKCSGHVQLTIYVIREDSHQVEVGPCPFKREGSSSIKILLQNRKESHLVSNSYFSDR